MKTFVAGSVALIASALFASAAGAQAIQAVEWKKSAGGNGHWYAVQTRVGPIDFLALESSVRVELGAHLATIPSQAEDSFVWNALDQPAFAVLGGFQDLSAADYSEPGGGWRWVTGEVFANPRWTFNEPSNGGGWEHILAYNYNQTWNDWQTNNVPQGSEWRYIIEWDADCNNDGIVDYGQIKSGQLDDDNGDGIPDACQYSVTGVIPVSGASSGGTAITIKGANFPENPVVRVGGVLATDVVRVSATRITAVTPAGLPGMTSVTVGNWVQPNAFYYRPECGSDLDQNGEVDAGDIAIILLDFGPCYVTPTVSQLEDLRPFMLREEPVPEIPLRK